MKVLIKVHKSYRPVVAICDSELLGKKFEEGIRQLDIRENFYKGPEFAEEEAIKVMQDQDREDATFNIVGENSVKLALKAGIITNDSTAAVQNIPYALKLL
jgi:uncharacterized protein